MNGKQARNLRKIVRNYEALAQLPERECEEIKHPERLVQVGLNVDGTPKRVPYVPVTRKLVKECKRSLYQQAKGLHTLFHV